MNRFFKQIFCRAIAAVTQFIVGKKQPAFKEMRPRMVNRRIKPGEIRFTRRSLRYLRSMSGLTRRHKVAAWYVGHQKMAQAAGGSIGRLIKIDEPKPIASHSTEPASREFFVPANQKRT